MTPNNDDHTQQPSTKLSESVRSTTTSNKKHHHEHSTHHSTQLKFVFTYQNQQIVIYDKQIRSLIFWLVIIFLHLSILILVYYRQQVPNFSSSASSLKLSEFSSQRCIAEARKFYNSSEAFFGRIVGSEEYRKSLQFLGNQLEQLKAKNDKFQNHLEMTIDFHYVKDGQATFSMRHPAHIFPNMKITLSYSNVTNILVRLHSKKHLQFLNESILVSSHFDSVPSTQSVSGTIPTFIALEMISNLIHDPDTIRHPVIFIFNSAKEIGLIGSKIFVTRHPWASTVRSVINMESIGSGASRDLTFQSTNTWVMKQFASVCKYPKATAVAQDFFSLGLIPSQSDFNVYTSYLNLTIGGIDSVFYRNGYVHHTNRDTIHTLNENTIQHMGENLVPFIKKLASFPTFFPNVNTTPKEDAIFEEITTPAVYFDVLSLFIFCYSSSSAQPVYNVIILIALTFMVRKIYAKEKEKKENRKKRRRRVSNASHELTATTSTSEDVTTSENSEIMTRNIHDEDERYIWSLLKAFGIVLLSLISSMLFPSLVALTLAFIFKNPMSWYATGSVFTLFLFAFPSILGITLVLAIFSSYTSSFYIYVSVWLFWVLVTLVFNWFNIVSGFLPVVVVLALVIASSHTIQKYTKWYIHLTIMMTGYLIFVLEHILIAVDIFVPIMSRSGFVNSIWKCDVSIACFIGFIAFLATNLLYPFVISENQRKSQIANSNKLHLVIFLSVSLVLMIFSGLMLAPYSEAAPKRVLVQKVIVLPDEDFDTSMAIGVRKGGISEILHLSNDLDMNMESPPVDPTTWQQQQQHSRTRQKTYISLLHTDSVPVQYVMNGNLGALQTILTNSKEHEIYLIPALAIQQVTSIDYDSFIAIDFNSSSISSDSPQPSSYLRENPVKTLTFGSKNNVTIILESDMLVLSQEIRLYLKPEHVVSSSIDNMQHRGEFLSFFHLYASSRGDFSKILQFNILLASHAPRQFHLQILSHYTQSESTNFLFNSEILPFTAKLLPNTFISPIYTIVTDTIKTIKLR